MRFRPCSRARSRTWHLTHQGAAPWRGGDVRGHSRTPSNPLEHLWMTSNSPEYLRTSSKTFGRRTPTRLHRVPHAPTPTIVPHCTTCPQSP
jgi:hypothetical protein